MTPRHPLAVGAWAALAAATVSLVFSGAAFAGAPKAALRGAYRTFLTNTYRGNPAACSLATKNGQVALVEHGDEPYSDYQYPSTENCIRTVAHIGTYLASNYDVPTLVNLILGDAKIAVHGKHATVQWGQPWSTVFQLPSSHWILQAHRWLFDHTHARTLFPRRLPGVAAAHQSRPRQLDRDLGLLPDPGYFNVGLCRGGASHHTYFLGTTPEGGPWSWPRVARRPAGNSYPRSTRKGRCSEVSNPGSRSRSKRTLR